MSQTIFKPTSLDLALKRDPITRASEHGIFVATREPTATAVNGAHGRDVPTDQGSEATRRGQLVTAAAGLAGGMIAAEGHAVTTAEAVEKVRAVLDELDHV